MALFVFFFFVHVIIVSAVRGDGWAARTRKIVCRTQAMPLLELDWIREFGSENVPTSQCITFLISLCVRCLIWVLIGGNCSEPSIHMIFSVRTILKDVVKYVGALYAQTSILALLTHSPAQQYG